MNKHAMDVDTAETLAGVVRYSDRPRYSRGLPRIVRRLDQLHSSSPWVSTWLPTRPAPIAAPDALDDLRATVADLVWEANTGVGA